MKKQDVQISIIVPIYKVEKYLVRCVESLIAQDFLSLEIILIDDGSLTGAEKFVTIMQKKMHGLSLAINRTAACRMRATTDWSGRMGNMSYL